MKRRDFLKGLLASSISALVVIPSLGNNADIDVVENVPEEFEVGDWNVSVNVRSDFDCLQVYAVNENLNYIYCKLFDNDKSTKECVKTFIKSLKLAEKRAMRRMAC